MILVTGVKNNSIHNYYHKFKLNFKFNSNKNSDFTEKFFNNTNSFEKESIEHLKLFLKNNFKVKEESKVIYFLRNNPQLIKYLYNIPSLFSKEFPEDNLLIKLVNEVNNPYLYIYVCTSEDGFEASDKLDLIEDAFYDGEDFLNKILLSVEFK